ncbi:MAG TPA: right-handed parallel beta-helix repeat-containing protein [Syntrophorhabdaceae bacterium]|nr:right-handed parallel beta-helix repeat-containing protein [Syntrophorhabdaceae bacterium]
MVIVLINVSKALPQGPDQELEPIRKFYVATDGDDRFSGTHSIPDPSGTDGPFATLQKARDTVRALRAKGSGDAFSIIVRGGRYELSETLVLGPEDSGTESHPLVYRAFDNEKPVLTGAKRVNNFEPYKGKILQVRLGQSTGKVRSVRELFADGKRQILARYPNYDPRDPIGGGFLYVASPDGNESKRKFRYRGGDLREWANLRNAEVFIYPGYNWGGGVQTILSIDKNRRVITLANDVPNEIKMGNRYYFQNVFEELDSPGEWYFDKEREILYYWPPDNVDLAKITVPTVKSILEIRGKRLGERYYGTPADIRFEGFTFEGCEGSAVVVTGARRITIARSTIHNAGGNGVEIHDGFENLAFGNDIYDIGGSGITISGGDQNTLTPGNNRAEDNYIFHVGVLLKDSSGVYCQGVGNVVSHNLIHSTPRVGIWFDGNDHQIEYNHVYQVNQETQDSGIIYGSQIDWTKRGSVIRFNYLHDSGGYGRSRPEDPWQRPFETYGIYLDDWTSGTSVYGNIVANTTTGGILIHGGRDNVVQNNVIIDGGSLGQMVYSAWPPDHPVAQKLLPAMFTKVRETRYKKYPELSTITDIATGAKMSGNTFVRNIVYYKGQRSVLYGIYNGIDLDTTKSDYNVIYHAGLPLHVFLIRSTTQIPSDDWSAWRDRGLDTNSKIANPLFADPDKNDFSLLPESPALKMGFKPIPIGEIGPYNNTLRATWPVN